MREAKPGDILVVDGKGYTERAVAGNFVIGLVKSLGLQGIIISGAIRDIQGIYRDLDFPVFCRASTISASTGKMQKANCKFPYHAVA